MQIIDQPTLCAAVSRKKLFKARTGELSGSESRTNYIKACKPRRQDNGFCFLGFPICSFRPACPGTHCEIQHDSDSAASMQHPAGHAAGWIQEFAGHDPITSDGLPILAM